MRELMRAAVRLHILHHAAEEDIHGAWMAEELANHGYSISPGTLYPTLHRMEEEGLLLSRPEVVGGRPRRVYRATKAGLDALGEGRRSVAELAAEILPQPIEREQL
ncbi:PadR family transcriptional regulator [Arthrobacter sp. LAPM80]|uniref:PadR family transcriptional regulator n=1 Tax=Arthrobacter sp. LAPM80 TaxID=3141788 RepID=UPI00398A6B70